MRIKLLTILSLIALLGAGCSNTHEHDGSVHDADVAHTAEGNSVRSHKASTWGKYLDVMTDKERDEFFAISDSFERKQWVRRNGVDVRADLAKKLTKGLKKGAAMKRIKDRVEDTIENGDSTLVLYSRFNTVSRTNFYLVFHKNTLASWGSYTRENQDRNREVFDFESRLMRKFDTVLKVDMGANEIRKQAENARKGLNDVKIATRDVTGEPDYKGTHTNSYANYIVAEQILLAETRNELFKWFQGRDADKVLVQRPYETHQYYMLYTAADGAETVITAEFVFKDGLLKRWFVYHEK